MNTAKIVMAVFGITNISTLSNYYAIYKRTNAPFIIVVYQKVILENSEQFRRTRSEVFH